MHVVAFAVEDAAESVFGKLLPGVDRRRVVITGFTHHVGQASLRDQVKDLLGLLGG